MLLNIRGIPVRMYNLFLTFHVIFPDALHEGLSSSHSHSLLGHSPGVVAGARETDRTVDYSKENKRGHNDRGKTHWYIKIGSVSLGSGSAELKNLIYMTSN